MTEPRPSPVEHEEEPCNASEDQPSRHFLEALRRISSQRSAASRPGTPVVVAGDGYKGSSSRCSNVAAATDECNKRLSTTEGHCLTNDKVGRHDVRSSSDQVAEVSTESRSCARCGSDIIAPTGRVPARPQAPPPKCRPRSAAAVFANAAQHVDANAGGTMKVDKSPGGVKVYHPKPSSRPTSSVAEKVEEAIEIIRQKEISENELTMIKEESMLQNYGSDLMKKSLFTALVFSISADVELKKRTFDIKYKISQFLQQDVPYLRFQGKEGNFVLNKRDIQDERRVFS